MKKRNKEDLFWISGGIDSHGVIIAHEGWHGDDASLVHTDEEKAGTPWRWNVCQQEFMNPMIWQKRHLTEEEVMRVEDWLIKRSYMNKETEDKFNDLRERIKREEKE